VAASPSFKAIIYLLKCIGLTFSVRCC